MEAKKKRYRDVQKFNQSVIHNFDLSIVMSFYKRYEEFSRVLPRNLKYLQRNGIEVIIVMDEPTEKKQVLDQIRQYPFINWKLIVNEQEHAPRNHAPVLNVGIRHATKKYILQIDPEVEYYTDVVLQMREMLEHYPRHYVLAPMAYIPLELDISQDNIGSLDFIPYGNIMVEREYLEELGGYDESFMKWGGEDDNLRSRLDLIGLKKLLLPEAKTLHREKEYNPGERMAKVNAHPVYELRRMFYPTREMINNNSWGREFNKVLYDWQNNIFAEEQCRKYLEDFVQFEIKDSSVFLKQYKKLILCQAYNENEFMKGFLEDMSKYFDGIILLDDGSTDNTWRLANHDKILLKVKKKRECFNDLENRNILLNLSSFFNSEWFCFMDIDERFDKRYVDFQMFENNFKINVVAFYGVYLWGSQQTYIINIPASENGVMKRARMFRNIGRSQILTSMNKLHFSLSPFVKNTFMSNILFKDSGILNRRRRIQKYFMYRDEDVENDDTVYEYLIRDNAYVESVDEIFESFH